jgi:hypothetical protein
MISRRRLDRHANRVAIGVENAIEWWGALVGHCCNGTIVVVALLLICGAV